jgi:hypothetical protein
MASDVLQIWPSSEPPKLDFCDDEVHLFTESNLDAAAEATAWQPLCERSKLQGFGARRRHQVVAWITAAKLEVAKALVAHVTSAEFFVEVCAHASVLKIGNTDIAL